jgi:hypothetical protein
MPLFETYGDYELPLLQVLEGLPGGQGATRDVLDLFWQRFSPNIPPEYQLRLPNRRELKWQNMVMWTRNTLVKRGLMDAPRYGVWRITQAGRERLVDASARSAPMPAIAPLAQRAPAADSSSEGQAMPANEPPSTLDRAVVFTMAGQRFSLTGRQALEQARRAMAHGLPEEAHNYISWAVEIDGQLVGVKWLFKLITGLSPTAFQTNQARPVLEHLGLAVHHIEAAATTLTPGVPVSQDPTRGAESVRSALRGPVAIFDNQITAIRDFLKGRASRPSDEVLCDWVHFCYSFELYREGRDLFRLIDPSRVNDWYYDRTRRLARVCAMKVAGQA